MQIRKITTFDQIPPSLQQTPVAQLIRYQNLGEDFKTYQAAEILVAMCMDNRKQLRIPEYFAYIIRTGGANLRYNEFKVSYAIAIGKIKYVVLIAHDQCGMVNLISRREEFVEGMCQICGWDRARAEEHFMNYAPIFEIDNEIDFVWTESKRLAEKYPGVTVVPLYYSLDDNMLSLIEE